MSDLVQSAHYDLDAIVNLRRRLHRTPELAFHELQTADIIMTELSKLGVHYQYKGQGHGIIAFLDFHENAPRIALRAELDALPGDENTGLEFSSENPHKMHACGHDAQTTVSDAICRAAFVQALAFYLRETAAEDTANSRYQYDYWLEKDNLYQASHLGLNAELVYLADSAKHQYKTILLRDWFESVLNQVIEFVESSSNYSGLIDLSYLQQLRQQVAKEYGYQIQLHRYEEKLSLKSVTQQAVSALESGLGG